MKKIFLIEKIELTYKVKNYRPLIKYIFKNKHDYLQNIDPERNFNDPSIFPDNFMELIYQVGGSKEEELVTDVKMVYQEVNLNIGTMHLLVSDLKKSFLINVAASDFAYKIFRVRRELFVGP